MLTHTKVFKVVQPINRKSKTLVTRTLEQALPSIMETEITEEKVFRQLDERTVKFQKFYKEKHGIDQATPAAVRPGVREVLVNLNILKNQPPEELNKLVKVKMPAGNAVSTDSKTVTIIVDDLKPGENPDAYEQLPPWKGIDNFGRMTEDDVPREHGFELNVHDPEDEREVFDVYKVVEEKERKARKEQKKLSKQQESEEKETETKNEWKSSEESALEVRDKVSSENK